MRSFHRELFPRFLLWTYAGHVNLARQSLGGLCQSGKMAALLNSLFFVFKISFLPKYRSNIMIIIVNWSSGICNWRVSLDILPKC